MARQSAKQMASLLGLVSRMSLLVLALKMKWSMTMPNIKIENHRAGK
jgi:hypothetical protein